MQTEDGWDKDSSVPCEFDPRLWPRGAGDSSNVTLWTNIERSQSAKVVDESQTGIAILVDDATGLFPDCEVRLVFHGEPMWALVRNVTETDEGKARIGLEWGCADSRMPRLIPPTRDVD